MRNLFARIQAAEAADRSARCARGLHASILRSRTPGLQSVCLDCHRACQ